MNASGEPLWLDLEDVIQINIQAVRETNETHLVRDRAALESGTDRARNRFGYGESDLFTLAAHLAFGIGKAHAFEQGNKRTAWASMRLFLFVNSITLQVTDDQLLLGAWILERMIATQGEEEADDAMKALRIYLRDHRRFRTVGRPGLT